MALLLEGIPGEDVTAISERLKNWDRKEIYSLTISKDMVRHWEGLRRLLNDDEVDAYECVPSIRIISKVHYCKTDFLKLPIYESIRYLPKVRQAPHHRLAYILHKVQDSLPNRFAGGLR